MFLQMTFKQKGREESCEMDDPEPGQKICKLYGIENWQLFYGNFIRPKIKVGSERMYKDTCICVFVDNIFKGWHRVGVQGSERGQLPQLGGRSRQDDVQQALPLARRPLQQNSHW